MNTDAWFLTLQARYEVVIRRQEYRSSSSPLPLQDLPLFSAPNELMCHQPGRLAFSRQTPTYCPLGAVCVRPDSAGYNPFFSPVRYTHSRRKDHRGKLQ